MQWWNPLGGEGRTRRVAPDDTSTNLPRHLPGGHFVAGAGVSRARLLTLVPPDSFAACLVIPS